MRRWPRRGDIWLVDLNPTAGREQQGRRPVLVISPEAFNRSGLALVCPITQGGQQARFAGFAVTLMGAGTSTQGMVMGNQVRTLDIAARHGTFIEAVPEAVMADVLAKVQTLME